MQPGAGYSINIYHELFTGKKPDEIGFFNIWQVKRNKDNKYKLIAFIGEILDTCIKSFYLRRLIRFGLFKLKLLPFDMSNIPFSMLPYISQNKADSVFSTSENTVLSDYKFKILSASDIKNEKGHRDKEIINQAQKIKNGDNIFLLLGDLDALAHKFGMGQEFYTHLKQCDTWIGEIISKANENHEKIIVISDHGMEGVNDDGVVDLQIEQKLGKPSENGYLYFLDATIARFWYKNDAQKKRVRAHMKKYPSMQLVSPQRRKELGISNSDYGDDIYFIDEKKYIHPCFLGSKKPKALHGYDPGYKSQVAYVGCNFESGLKHKVSTKDINKLLRKLLS